ncbi:MAG: DegV family protein [Chloroflexi bacterium]|nr:DegV family protein [Chloroflexota bacterium]MCA2001976.1 DegV family protein [Chloroflexota bacterium]
MLGIATDGAIDLAPGWEKEFDIRIVPINVHFGEKTYIQNIDLDLEGFYRLVDDTSNPFPKTSQPSPHQFVEFYKKNFQPGDTVVSLHVTSKLSGTYASAVAAAEELKGVYNIIPFDSLGGSMGTGFMCRAVRLMERAGKSVEDILRYLEAVRSQVKIVLTLDTLEYARRSGRVGTLSAALASLLNVKPIASLQEGLIQMVEKVRTRKAALERVLAMGREMVGDKPVHIGVMHARDLESGKTLLEAAKKNFNFKSAEMADLSISLAINLGVGTVGLVLYPAE